MPLILQPFRPFCCVLALPSAPFRLLCAILALLCRSSPSVPLWPSAPFDSFCAVLAFLGRFGPSAPFKSSCAVLAAITTRSHIRKFNTITSALIVS